LCKKRKEKKRKEKKKEKRKGKKIEKKKRKTRANKIKRKNNEFIQDKKERKNIRNSCGNSPSTSMLQYMVCSACSGRPYFVCFNYFTELISN